MISFDWQLIGFQLAIIIPFAIGSFMKKYFSYLPKYAHKIVILNLIAFEPPIIVWSIWGLPLSRDMFFLPLAGLMMVVLGFGMGKLASPLLDVDFIRRKVFVISSSLANHGFTMGGVICYLFLGEKGLALAAIFIMYFVPFTFLFIFFYAARGTNHGPMNLFRFFINIRNMPLGAVLLAIFLRGMEFERPDIRFPLNTFLAISIALYYFTLGLNFNAGDLNPFKREHGLLAGIKFIVIPAVTYLVLLSVDLNADLSKVILIESVMPVAVYGVITAILFQLEPRYASSIFIVNSVIFIVAILPLLCWLRV